MFVLYNAVMSNPNKPPVSIENIPEVYEHYQDNDIDPRITRFGYATFSAIFKTHVSLWSEDADEYLSGQISDGKQLILASNHLNAFDQSLLSPLTLMVESLEPLIGTTFIPAKINLFQNRQLRWAVEHLGAIPAYRGKDFDDRLDPRREIAKEGLLATSIERMNRGQHMGIYPEQTRNRRDPHTVQQLRRGIGEIAFRTTANPNIMILPVGNVVGTLEPKERKLPKAVRGLRSELYDFRNSRHAYIHIGEPIEGPFDSPDQVMQQLAPAMQASVDTARALQTDDV